MPGPPPKPTALKILEGNPGEKALTKNEPKPTLVAYAEPPAALDDFGQMVWRKIMPVLTQCGLLTEADLPLYERYCELWSDWKKCCDFLNSKERTYYPVFDGDHRDSEGNRIVKQIKEYPQVNKKFRINGELLKIEAHLGMTPAARTRIMLEDSPLPTISSGGEEEDPFEVDD